MQYLSYALPLAALVSGSFANPLERRGGCQENACLAAVTGKAALGDDHLRGAHCASFLATTVTPPAVTVTETVTDSSWADWKAKRGVSVTVCPNEVPNYASACDNAAYTSACSCFGFTEIKTTTVAPTTTTKTVYVAPTGGAAPTGGSCAPTTVTKTLASGTTCPAGATTTVTVTGGSWGSSTSAVATTTTTVSSTPSACIVTDSLASGIVANFSLLLEYTSYAGQSNPPIPAGRGYKQDVSDATLASDFSDISDSINFMAGFSVSVPKVLEDVSFLLTNFAARLRDFPHQASLRLRPGCSPTRSQRLYPERLARLQQHHLEMEIDRQPTSIPSQRHQLHDH